MNNEEVNKEYVIDCENLIKIYKTEDIEVVALQGLDLTIEKGEFTAIIGNSGSGKSTLLNMIGALDKASAGKLIVDGKDLFKINEKELIAYKRDSVGFVWQNNSRNLIPYLTARENIEMILDLKFSEEKEEKNPSSNLKSRFLSTVIGGKSKERAKELLDMVELRYRENSRLYELSGGEQQRVAIAIALANNPKILLADEPTGQVDTKTTGVIFDIFRKLNRELGQTILIVTHDRALAKKVNRVISISDGRTNSEFIRNTNYAEALSNLDNNFEREEEQEEFAVIDRIGRVHLPKDYVDKLKANNNRIKVKEQNEGIILYK